MRCTTFVGFPGRLAILLALLSPGCFADLGPTPGSYELDKLFAQADAVCVGRIEHPVESVSGVEGGIKEVSRTVGLSARRCYKGEVATGDTIEYTTHVPGIHATDVVLPAGSDVLVFLRETRPHWFTLAFPFFGKLSDASLGTLAPERASGLEQLQSDIVASTVGTADRNILEGNFRVLHGFPSLFEEALTLLRTYSKSGDANIAMGAFSALAKAGDPSDLFALCRNANAAAPVASVKGYYNFASIGRIRNPDARAALECLARTPRFGVYAMEGLQAIGSPASVPELMKHLDDSDSMMQYLAVIILSEIVRRPDEAGPAIPTFENDKSRFIESWKRWWNDTGHLRYPDAQAHY